MNNDNNLYRSVAKLALTTGLLLLIPLIAMQYFDDVVWTLSDFIIAGTLLFGTGFTYKLITRRSGETAYRIAVGFALFTGLFLIWVNMAVGIIGSENNPVNLIYFGIPAVGIIGAFIVRFRPDGMVYAMFAMAFGQLLATVIALYNGIHQTPEITVIHILGVNGFFISLFIAAALLFHYAAQIDKQADEGPEV